MSVRLIENNVNTKIKKNIAESIELENDFVEDNEYEGSRYTFVKSKPVTDSDGFSTEYCMYYDNVEDRYVFVFGDSDLYNPYDSDFDYEAETEQIANEWFDSYEGIDYEDSNLELLC